jgi:aminoglycoside phosphotransferase (APT) family kinase protein
MSQVLLDEAGAVRDENAFDPATILPFLKSQVPDLADGPLELRQFQGGASNLTYELRVGARRMILRRPPGGTKPKSGHDMHREFRVMKALAPHFPCPRVLAYSEDPALLGAPFYVMEKVEGIILRRDLPKGLAYTPERARQLCLNLVDTLIKLHTLDYKSIGLADLGHPEGSTTRPSASATSAIRRATSSARSRAGASASRRPGPTTCRSASSSWRGSRRARPPTRRGRG